MCSLCHFAFLIPNVSLFSIFSAPLFSFFPVFLCFLLVSVSCFLSSLCHFKNKFLPLFSFFATNVFFMICIAVFFLIYIAAFSFFSYRFVFGLLCITLPSVHYVPLCLVFFVSLCLMSSVYHFAFCFLHIILPSFITVSHCCLSSLSLKHRSFFVFLQFLSFFHARTVMFSQTM